MDRAERLKRLKKLSDREFEIARFRANGIEIVDIADELRISTHTVKYHVTNIYRKLGIRGAVASKQYQLIRMIW